MTRTQWIEGAIAVVFLLLAPFLVSLADASPGAAYLIGFGMGIVYIGLQPLDHTGSDRPMS